MKRLLVSVFLFLIFIQIGNVNAQEIKLTNFIWAGEVYLVVSYPMDHDLAVELSEIWSNCLERVSEFKDEWGQSVHCEYACGPPVWMHGRTEMKQYFRIKVAGMFTVKEVDFWQDGMISRHAIDLWKDFIEMICTEMNTHEDVIDYFPLVGKVWNGDSCWEPCDPHVRIWYPDKYYEDLVRILEYRNGEFYRDYYKHTISTNPEPFFLALTLVTVVIVIGLMKKRK